MKSKLIFRVQNLPGTGLGHLMRSIAVAKALADIDIEACFILDQSWPSELEGIKPHSQRILVLNEVNESEKNMASLDFAQLNNANFLYVDSYEIPAEWYEHMSLAGMKIIKIIDDLNQLERNAYCIPYGIRFCKDRSKNFNSLEKSAINNAIVEWGSHKNQDLESEHSGLNLLLYLGATPKSDLIDLILPQVLKGLKFYQKKVNLTILVQKSQVKEKTALFNDSENYSLRFMEFSDKFNEILQMSDFILASSSNIIYEAAALNLPIVTFPMNTSQQNFDFQLECIGHYFNFSSVSDLQDENFPMTLQALLNNLDRVRNLESRGKYRINQGGSKNLANEISNKLMNPDLEDAFTQPKLEDPPATAVSTSVLEFRVVTDGDVNLVLEGRNKPTCRKFMVNQNPITKPAHYLWWLSTTRDHFIGEIGSVPIIYIWHQVIETNGKKFLIGGWFPLHDSIHVTDILKTLQWQIETTQRLFPNVPWVATIHENNMATASLATRIGFREVIREEDLYTDISNYFFPDGMTPNFKLYSRE